MRAIVFLIFMSITSLSNASIIRYDFSGLVVSGSSQFPSIENSDSWFATFFINTDELIFFSAINTPDITGRVTVGDNHFPELTNDSLQLVAFTPIPGNTFGQLNIRAIYNTDTVQIDGITIESIDLSVTFFMNQFLELEDTIGMKFDESDFRNPSFNVFGDESISGTVTSFSTTIVPIPAAVWLFGSALVGLIGIKRFKLR